jgi:chromosome segregation ATPase
MAEVKFMAEKKISDARALEASLEEKSLEIEAKLHSADARLAEASRKNSQADHKLEEIQERERKFDKDKLSYDTEYAPLLFAFFFRFVHLRTLCSVQCHLFLLFLLLLL